MTCILTVQEGEGLVRLARAAIEDRLEPRDAVREVLRALDLTPGLAAPRAVFVTLLEGPAGALRGCIGSTEADAPAHEAVVDAAIQAAFQDPRFAPLTVEEYRSIDVSVSALTPARLVSTEQIVLGEDGVILEHRLGRAVFLPEVAAEHRWTLDQLLLHLCRKAGVPDGSWRDGRLLAFRSQKFGGC